MNVNSRSKSTLVALAILCLAPVPGIRAQGAASAAAAPTKIAVINIRNAIVATAEGKLAQAQLQSQFAPKQNELQSTQKQVEDLQRRLNEGARTLSDDEKSKMQRQGELLTRRLQRGNDDLTEELNAAQAEVVDGTVQLARLQRPGIADGLLAPPARLRAAWGLAGVDDPEHARQEAVAPMSPGLA